MKIQQCTIVENSADNFGGGGVFLGVMCTAAIDYTVLSRNCAPEGPDLHGGATSTAFLYQTAIDTTRIAGGMRWDWYERLVTGDPGLCRLAGCYGSELGDYRLRPDSPCADPRIGALRVGCE
jgi:hypothetical protein